MARHDPDWIYVCDDCGTEWPTSQPQRVKEHELAQGHEVYQRHTCTYRGTQVTKATAKDNHRLDTLRRSEWAAFVARHHLDQVGEFQAQLRATMRQLRRYL